MVYVGPFRSLLGLWPGLEIDPLARWSKFGLVVLSNLGSFGIGGFGLGDVEASERVVLQIDGLKPLGFEVKMLLTIGLGASYRA